MWRLFDNFFLNSFILEETVHEVTLEELWTWIGIFLAIALAISFVAYTLSETVYVNSIVLMGAGGYLAWLSFQVYGMITNETFIEIVFKMYVCCYIISVFLPAEVHRIRAPSGQLFVFEFRRGFILQAIISIFSAAIALFFMVIIGGIIENCGFKIVGFLGVIAFLGGFFDLGPSTATVIKYKNMIL